MHVFTQNVCEDKNRRTIAKSYFLFIDNSHLEQCQNKRITMGKPHGFIEIEVGELHCCETYIGHFFFCINVVSAVKYSEKTKSLHF